jgi:hypothetical protein
MQMTIDTHTFLPETAQAASALPCWRTPVEDRSQAGNVGALAEGCVR